MSGQLVMGNDLCTSESGEGNKANGRGKMGAYGVRVVIVC